MKKRKTVIIVAVVLLAAVWAFFVVRVSLYYKRDDPVVYQMGEEAPLPETYAQNVTMRVDEAHFFSNEAYDELKIPGMDEENHDLAKCILITLTLTNHGSEDQVVDLTPMQPESRAWTNGINMHWFKSMVSEEEQGTLYPTVPAGESVRINLPFNINEIHFQSKEWDTVTEREYSLVFSLYPRKESILLRMQID